ncbi:hypothetical protein [Bifidobacterium sp. SO1]|uniref:WDGH domain-containing protein n=1 Tax=Bifidobacterium sp. SO1 TaxID=2809029 RepID=UPI001F0B6EA4|nr:hypothetical protein [Bifidobacterium sp. SO1]
MNTGKVFTREEFRDVISAAIYDYEHAPAKALYTTKDAADELYDQHGEPVGDSTSDGYHTFGELYRYRMLYNAAFLNVMYAIAAHLAAEENGTIADGSIGKSKVHADGKPCFGGGWFIVWASLDTGIVANHYELKYWDLFDIPEYEHAPEWDGSTPQEQADRLEQWLHPTDISEPEES